MFKIHIVVLKRTNNKCEMKRKSKVKRNNCRKAGMYILAILIVVLANTTYNNETNKGMCKEENIHRKEIGEKERHKEKVKKRRRESTEKNTLLEEMRAGFASRKLKKNSGTNTNIPRKYHRWMKQTEKETAYFPLPEPADDVKFKITFENSWMLERTYGGKRGHEGCDLMAVNSKAGMCPVVSMTDGTIANLGWTEKGGYRIGVTSKSGTYYYYAHLHSFGNKERGDTVIAGEVIGFMGDSGYGKEGTTGKFPVHLHVGIYKYDNGTEISVNPYYILQKCRKQSLKYHF